MNEKEFRAFGKATVDYVADYNENLRDRPVLPSVTPGYLYEFLPAEAPEQPESWQQILQDVEQHIMPGVTHWNSPRFHAYYPTANSYPAIVGEMLSAGIGCLGVSWIASPACTELETIAMDWLAQLLGLPQEFLNSSPGPGGGVIQGSASESTLAALFAARESTVERLKKEGPDLDEVTIRSKLVTYTSDQSNSSVEKGGRLSAMPMRLLPADKRCSLRGATLLEQVKKDLQAGLIPCCLVATLGTTATCAFDNLDELGPICKKYKIWLHVDAAYAGAAFVCPEYRHWMSGIEYVDSFNVNCHKWLLVNADCSALWVRNDKEFTSAFNVNQVYLENDSEEVRDYRHWQVPLGRRFRALKLWFVMRLYGVEGLQKHIRHTVYLAKMFENLVNRDGRFEIPVEVNMGLICFKLKGPDTLTKQLLDRLMERKKIYVIPGAYAGKTLVRFVVCSRFSTERDIQFAWTEISSVSTKILQSKSRTNPQPTLTIREFEIPNTKQKSVDMFARLMNFKMGIEKQTLCS
ncbi:hypothetical protein QAD02_010560 [Eretmocerus hayati]|uniref:Uncharacterized protein n=1 Tax=Eretmocerus hayati TaxID=131215 RepID=A0ACC2NUK8_9HYME|nr:hypothetical protein QAD02_010560 [Eretmocerus hayati]